MLRKSTKSVSSPTWILIAILLLLLTSVYRPLSVSIQGSILRKTIISNWLSIDFTFANAPSGIQDGIPDYWQPISYGGAVTDLSIVNSSMNEPSYIRIKNNTDDGSAGLWQDAIVTSSDIVTGVITSRLGPSAVEIWMRGDTNNEWTKRGIGGWVALPASEDWQTHVFSTTLPEGFDLLRTTIRTSETVDVQEIELYITTNSDSPIILNNDFQLDGRYDPPLTWWVDSVSVSTMSELAPGDFNLGPAYTSALILMSDDPRTILSSTNTQYVTEPEEVSWLIDLPLDDVPIDKQGWIRERLNLLAMFFYPHNSRPYAAMAELMEEQDAYKLAFEYYVQAAELSDTSTRTTDYLLKAGLIALRRLKDLELTEQTFRSALDYWDGTGRSTGPYLLSYGEYLLSINEQQEAISVFESILACGECAQYYPVARSKLRQMDTQQ
jgi:hypothetical protein